MILRRYHDHGHGDPSETCRGESRTLERLSAATTVAVPKPVWLDSEGLLFGQPALVETSLPGRAVLGPADLDRYVAQLAEALASIHAIELSPGSLGDWAHAVDQETWLARKFGSTPPDMDLRQRGGPEVREALLRLRPHVPVATRKVVLHGDYWPGNTLWLRGRLTGVVDWENPWIGNPAMDVSYCRQDLAMLFDLDVADRFLAHYERSVGRRIDDFVFWDLIAVTRALPEVEDWLLGYHDLGRTDISPALMRARHSAYMNQALGRAA